MAKNKRFPDFSKLGISILESLVKPVIGDKAVDVIKEPVKEKELRDGLITALHETEKRFVEEYDDKELREAILDLPLADLPKLQEATRDFYSRPSSNDLKNLLMEQLTSDYPRLGNENIEKAVNEYLAILRQELTQVSDEIRQKLFALATLEINDTLHSLLSGDVLYKKYAESPTLSTYIYTSKFKTLVEERTRTFVGRDFVFNAIDNLIKGPSFRSGYIIVSGEPGIGKTAFIAEMVKRKGYVHHFNHSLQNIRTTRDFLSNICAQLIVRYELNHFTLPHDATNNSGFLSELLEEVAEKEKGKPIIVLVDALDEAENNGDLPEGNILCLPPSLPKGIYFVVTTREKHDYRLVVDQQMDIYIRDSDPQNLDDVRKYVSNFIQENYKQIKSRMQKWGILEGEFIEIIAKKSEGNFMYLVRVLKDILDEKLTTANMDDVRNLPNGLKNYYKRHWRIMRTSDKAQFDKYQEPVICILATIREPVTIELVQEWTGLDPRQIKNVINEWQEFLNIDDSGEEILYRLYHASFQNFLKEEVGLGKYHEKIAMTALQKIPGFFK